MSKKVLCIILSALSVFLLTSCTGENVNDVTDYVYNPTANETEAVSESVTVNGLTEKDFTINTAWQKNYQATYRYYNKENAVTSVTVRETKTDKVFAVEYIGGQAATQYYKADGSDTELYTISTSENTHTVLKNKSFTTLSSLFMKLSTVEKGFSSLSNVMYMGEETIAGRQCQKYIQRAYTDGEVTETVYIWIDTEFGFGVKCTAMDATETLTMSWELTEFSTGKITEKDTGITLSSYKFTEVEE